MLLFYYMTLGYVIVFARTLRWTPGEDLGDRNVDDICYMGIEHLLTPVCMWEVMASKKGCIYAVLSEQARHGQSAKYRWEAIALASITQSRGASSRARRLGELHRDSI